MLFKLMLCVIIMHRITQVSMPFAQLNYEEVNYVFNFNVKTILIQTHLKSRNHLKLSQSNNQRATRPPQNFQQQENKSTHKEMLMKYMQKKELAIQND